MKTCTSMRSLLSNELSMFLQLHLLVDMPECHMILIGDGTSEMGAQMRTKSCYLICLRPFIQR